MKILFVSAVVPYPLYSGGQIRIYNLLKRLSVKNEITLLAFSRTKEEQQYAKNLDFCTSVHFILRGRAWQPSYILRSLGKYPFLLNTYDNAQMRKLVKEELARGKYDCLHIEPGYIYPSVPQDIHIPLVVAEHNIEHHIYEGFVRTFRIPFLRWLLVWDVWKLHFWEKYIWKKAAHVIAVSNDDRNVMSQIIQNDKITIVPNGVDIHKFTVSKKTRVDSSPRILFVGNFSWIQNTDAASVLVEEVFPRIKENNTDVHVRLVGRNMSAVMHKRLSKNSVQIADNVEDIQEEYISADVLVAPIRIGGGTKYKILEAMASGLPVVTTVKGAEGLGLLHERHALIADTPQEMADAVVRLLSDSVLRKNLIKHARQLIEDQYSWDGISTELFRAWQKSVQGEHV